MLHHRDSRRQTSSQVRRGLLVAAITIASIASAAPSARGADTTPLVAPQTSLATGVSHELVLRSDGTVWGAGSSAHGQAGRVPAIHDAAARQIAGLTTVSALAAGDDHSLALRTDGTVWAFGDNAFGQLGTTTNNGTHTANPVPAQVPGLSGVTAIAAGSDFSIALRADGTVWAWGDNAWGQLGSTTDNGVDAAHPTPAQIAGLHGVRAISAGIDHALALLGDGTVVAWGDDGYGLLGAGATVVGDNPHPVPSPVAGLSGVTAVAAGGLHNLALRTDGTVWGWGHNLEGQVSDGGAQYATPTHQLTLVPRAVAIAAGVDHSAVLASDGRVLAFGRGTSANFSNPTPAIVPSLTGVIAIAAGGDHTIALRADGSMWKFGDGSLAPLPIRLDLPPVGAGTPESAGLTATAQAEVFQVGADGTVQYSVQNADGSWPPFASTGALASTTVHSRRVGVSNNAFGNLELFVVGDDGAVYHNFSHPRPGQEWSGWSTLGAPASGIAGDVAVSINDLGNQELYVRTADGSVFHKYATPGIGSGWSNWDTMGRPPAGVRGDVAVGRNNLGNQELYVVSSAGTLYHNFATPGRGSGWHGWDPMSALPGTQLAGEITTALNSLGNQELYAVGIDNAVYHIYATPGEGPGWSGWSSMGAPTNAPLSPIVDVLPWEYRVLHYQQLTVRTTTDVYTISQTPGVGTGWTPWLP